MPVGIFYKKNLFLPIGFFPQITDFYMFRDILTFVRKKTY